MNQFEEEQIVSAVLNGNVDAFAVLIQCYQQPIFNLICRMTGSHADAADLAQDAFIKAYEQLYRFRQGKRFFPWLYTIALNHTRNFLRKRKNDRTLPIDDCELPNGSNPVTEAEEQMCMQLDSQRLQGALGKLPWEFREAVILRYREELSMDEIAEALSLSVSGAKMRVHRGLKKLRDILEAKNHDQ